MGSTRGPERNGQPTGLVLEPHGLLRLLDAPEAAAASDRQVSTILDGADPGCRPSAGPSARTRDA
jgi:hypothetical protein